MLYEKFELSTALANELPKRLHDNVICATFYSPNRHERQILLLTKLLEVFEVKSGEIIRAIDLTDSNLADLKLQEITVPPTKVHKVKAGSTSAVRSDETSGSLPQSYKFGKYISLEGNHCQIYILLQVFDKLIILERCQLEFKLRQQYEHVDRFEITDSCNSFRPKVNIVLKSGEMFETMFHRDCKLFESSQSETLEAAETLSQNQEKVQKASIELIVHKSFTKKEYISLKNNLTFGPNHLRSTSLEEKQPLRQCGDTWMKLYNEILVIGLPVKNSCDERPTTLENVRVVLICPETETTQYEYTLFQLVDDSCTYENFEKLLECETQENSLQFQEEWLPVKGQLLQPKCSGVIVLRMKWEINMLLSETSYLAFVLYNITANERTFTQQYRMQDIVIKPEIFFKDEYKVKFKEIELYQDLLVLSASFLQKGIEIEYQPDGNDPFPAITSFLNYELGFTCIRGSRQSSAAMEIDSSNTSMEEMYLHKENPCSYWYGTLLRLQASGKKTISMKIYTKSEDKILMLVQLLYKNMKNKIKALPVSYTSKGNTGKIQELEDKLRMELQLATKFCESNMHTRLLKRSDIFKFQQELLARELECDLAVMNLL